MADTARRVRRHAVEAVLLLLAVIGMVVLDVVPGPWWIPTAWVGAGVLLVCVAFTLWPGDLAPRRLHARSAVQTAGLVAITYATGWGAALVMTQLLAVADSVRHTGARAARPVATWAMASTVVAQAGVALGWVPSRIDPATGHALAMLGIGFVSVIAGRIERVTADKEAAEADARSREARFRTLLRASNDVILVISDGVIVSQVPEMSALGHHADDVVGRRYVDLVHPDDRDDVVASVVDMLSETGSTGLIEARFAHPDGHWVPMEFSCRNHVDDPTIRGFVVNARDITERRLLQAQLEYRAFHDVLTGLANRALLRERLERQLTAHARHGQHFAVLYLDIDEFKAINDSLGHDVGDQVLAAVAERLVGVLREADTASRLGGDEFALLLTEVGSPTDAARVAERTLHVLQQPLHVAGRTLHVNSSIGIVTQEDGATADELLRNADIAMYMAKRAGKGRFEVFETSMHVAVVDRLQLETDLAHALDRGELLLHYQPVVGLADERIVGVEALLRWQHPERGLVGPAEFIPLAEASGHIVPIGRWVLQEACRRVAAWQQEHPTVGPLEVAVNVSMHQLVNGDLQADVRDALEASGLTPAHLVLELTESALVERHGRVVEVLTALRADGVRIAIDDFGTGYSSLSYLQHLPVDVLKIDRSFVGGTVDGSQHPAVVQAIVDLGHTLDLQTVAEGIERDSELAHFRALQCQRGQGFLFARPDDGDAVEALLRAHSASAPPASTCQPEDGPEMTRSGDGEVAYRAG